MFSWLDAFLTNRQQYVVVDNCKSNFDVVKSGVPQGTVLGPVLFIIYINDLVDSVKNCSISLYADDAKIYDIVSSDTVSSIRLQDDLSRVQEWTKTWQLNVVIEKCSVLIFGRFVYAPSYFVGSVELGIVDEVNDLGFLISSNGKFSSHCIKISKKALRVASNIFRCFKSRNTDFLLQMFNTFIRPILEYGSQVWSPYLLKDIDKLEKVQRTYTKRIPAVSHLEYPERLIALNINSLEYRRILADLDLDFKICAGGRPFRLLPAGREGQPEFSGGQKP